jgi:hypothetical protein
VPARPVAAATTPRRIESLAAASRAECIRMRLVRKAEHLPPSVIAEDAASV